MHLFNNSMLAHAMTAIHIILIGFLFLLQGGSTVQRGMEESFLLLLLVKIWRVILTKCADRIVNARRSTMNDFLCHERPTVDKMQVSVSELHDAISVTRTQWCWDVTRLWRLWCWNAPKADKKWRHKTCRKCCRTAESSACRQRWLNSYVHTGNSAAMQRQSRDRHTYTHRHL